MNGSYLPTNQWVTAHLRVTWSCVLYCNLCIAQGLLKVFIHIVGKKPITLEDNVKALFGCNYQLDQILYCGIGGIF